MAWAGVMCYSTIMEVHREKWVTASRATATLCIKESARMVVVVRVPEE